MKPRRAPLTSFADGIQASFGAQFKALDGFDRMTRRWDAITSLPDLYPPTPAVKSVLASVQLEQQTMAKVWAQPLSESASKQVLASVAQITTQQSVSSAAILSMSVPPMDPVLGQIGAMRTLIESLRAGPIQQLVQQTKSQQRIFDRQVASVKPLAAERLIETLSGSGFKTLLRQLSATGGYAQPSLGRVVDPAMQRWLNDAVRQSTLFNDVIAKTANSATFAYQQQLMSAASICPVLEAITTPIPPFGGRTWIDSWQQWAKQAADAQSQLVDLIGRNPSALDVVPADGWVLPGSPGTLGYPILTHANFVVITREALSATPILAWIVISALIPHLGPAKWATAKLNEYDLQLFLLPIAWWLSQRIRAAGKNASEDD